MTEITDALTRLRAGCHEEVTRTGGELDACGRVAVAVVDFPGNDQAEPSMYPVCARHVRRQGHMIPLADLLAEVWDQSYHSVDADVAWSHYRKTYAPNPKHMAAAHMAFHDGWDMATTECDNAQETLKAEIRTLDRVCNEQARELDELRQAVVELKPKTNGRNRVNAQTISHESLTICPACEKPKPVRKTMTMTMTEIHAILDTARFGDRLSVTRSSGGVYTSYVEGPALVVSRAVGIDLLDGEPHVVRRDDGAVFGHIIEVELARKVNQ